MVHEILFISVILNLITTYDWWDIQKECATNHMCDRFPTHIVGWQCLIPACESWFCISSQTCVQLCHIGSLKYAMLRTLRSWKLTNTTNEDFFFFCLRESVCQCTTADILTYTSYYLLNIYCTLYINIICFFPLNGLHFSYELLWLACSIAKEKIVEREINLEYINRSIYVADIK